MSPEIQPAVCCRCGAKAVSMHKGRGRTTPYRTLPALELPTSLAVPRCQRCKSIFLEWNNATEVQSQLRALYTQSLRQRVRMAVDVLSRHIRQRRLELLLGLSQGYLSRLKAGAGNPSSELVCLLALLSLDPALLQTLERFWAQPDDGWHPVSSTVYAPMKEIRRRTAKDGKASRVSIKAQHALRGQTKESL